MRKILSALFQALVLVLACFVGLALGSGGAGGPGSLSITVGIGNTASRTTNDATSTVSLTKAPGNAQAGNVLELHLGANATGAAALLVDDPNDQGSLTTLAGQTCSVFAGNGSGAQNGGDADFDSGSAGTSGQAGAMSIKQGFCVGANISATTHLGLFAAAGTGTGTGGQIQFLVAPAGAGGSSVNTRAKAWVIDSAKILRGASTAVVGFAGTATPDSSAADTGLSRDSAGVIDFGTGAQGSVAGSWKATSGTLTGTLTSAAGSAAAPTVIFTGATTTGLYSPGANQLGLSVNGVGVQTFTGVPTSGAATTIAQWLGLNGAQVSRAWLHNNVTTSAGTSVNLATALPAGSQVLAVAYRITTTITGATGNIQLQDAGGNVYLSQGTLTSGTTAIGGSFGTAPAAFFNNFYNASNTFKIVTTAGTFTAGVVEVEILYQTTVAPTS